MISDMTTIDQMRTRFETIWPHLDEKGRRLWAASEAKAYGRGGLKIAHDVTGMSRSVIAEGLRNIAGLSELPEGRIRRAGAGRKALAKINVTLLEDLKTLVEGSTMGDPETPLLWTLKAFAHWLRHFRPKVIRSAM
jgi:hypothetical protein